MFGQAAGHLKIRADTPSTRLATPVGLYYYEDDPAPYPVPQGVDMILSNGAPRQVRTPQALVDVVTITNFQYEIRFYSPAPNFGSTVNGLYPVSGSLYKTIIVENPDGMTNTYNRLRITEAVGNSSNVSDYVWTDSSKEWTLTTGSGLRTESRSSSLEEGLSSNRVDTIVISNSLGQVVSKVIEHWQNFAWGSNMTSRVVNPDAVGGAALTTQWIYYDDVPTNNPNFSHLKMRIEPSGYWERYTYNAQGLATNTTTQFLNASTNAPDSECRVTEITYTNTAPHVTKAVKLFGHDISRTYEIDNVLNQANSTYDTTLIQCQSAEAGTNATDNLVTTTARYNNSGSPNWFNGEIQSIKRPDGTVSLYTYGPTDPTTTKITTHYSGAPNSSYSQVTNGTKTVTYTSIAGTVSSEIVSDVVTPSWVLAQSTMTQSDDFGRATMVVDLAGTNQIDYGCCGISSSADREGIGTSYTYDAFKRVVITARAGVTTSNMYDAADRVLATYRNGVRISSNVYDVAGRLTSSTDALTNTTTYLETRNASNETVKTTTYPDSSTRIETHFQDGQLKSLTGTAVHPTQYEYGVEQDDGIYRRYTKEIKLNGTGTNEWTKTYFDMVDRACKTVFADDSFSQSFYNNKGQLEKRVDPDGVTTLFAYNDRGELETTAIDMDRPGGSIGDGDRITDNVTDVVNNDLGVVRRTRTYAYSETGPVLTSISEVANSGLKSRTTAFGLTNTVVTTYDRVNAQRTVTATAPDGSYSVSVLQNGRLQSVTRKDSGNVQIGATTYGYDSQGRMTTNSDARTGAMTYTYNNADQQTSVTAGGQTTSYLYDSLGRRTRTTLPDSGTVNFSYYATGEIATNSGARAYPVVYTYDYAGRMKTLTTWKDFAGNSGAATTTWNHAANRGFLTSKVYDDSSTVTYSNTPAGRLARRTWARGVTTDYTYNNAGDLNAVTYSDSTPAVASVYDRRGRRTSVTNGTAVCTYTYNDAGQLLTETFPVAGVTITNGYDSLLRRSSLSSGAGGSPVFYGYDAASRLSTVAQASQLVTYSYLANSPLVSNITFKTSGATKMTTTKSYDNLNRLTSIVSVPSASSAVSFSYDHNSANQRTRRTDTDGSYWDYTYDSLGQVTSGHKKWSDTTSVAGQQYDYAFDDIGNGETSTANGRTFTYTANNLNQYTQWTVPGYLWELGSATNAATVTINNQSTTRKGDYFSKELSVANSSSAVYTQLVTVGVLRNGGSNQLDIVSTSTGKVFVAKSPEVFGNDSDGNLTNDGRWVYSWDGENRLISMETASAVTSVLANARTKLMFGYDSQFQRISKVVSNWNGNAWALASNLKFVYDGWNLAAELDATNGLVRSYTWGLDLSGSMQGAGGIGGLLAVNAGTNGTHFVGYDGNGNVMALVDAGSGSVTAQYEWSPFGEIIRATGPMAKVNPFRFSTKYTDDETGLVMYPRRPYSPSTGRWLTRDLLEEDGSDNLYTFVTNDPFNRVDPLGLEEFTSITIKRKTVKWIALLKQALGKKPAPDDPYGHWWIEFDGEGYGWWPKNGVSLITTLTGVLGQINGTDQMYAAGLATSTRDGHYGDSGDVEFHPKRHVFILFGTPKLKYSPSAGKHCKCVTEGVVKDCLRKFAQSYSGSWSWPWGQNCHSFQKGAMNACCLTN